MILHCCSVAVRSYPFFLPIRVDKYLPEATSEVLAALCQRSTAGEYTDVMRAI
jgi:hypothetical protein